MVFGPDFVSSVALLWNGLLIEWLLGVFGAAMILPELESARANLGPMNHCPAC